MNLIANLLWLAARWVDEQANVRPSVSLKTLSSRSTNDGKLFDRIEAGRPIEIPTYEKCVRFLSQSSNWPSDAIPVDVHQHLALLQVALSRPAEGTSANVKSDDVRTPLSTSAAA